MQTPLQITFHGLPHSEAVEAKIREKAAKLEEFHPGIISCRVVVEEQRLHHHQGRQFNVRIDLRVPGHDIDVNRDHHEDVYVALRDAFDAAKRLIEETIREQRGDVKAHEQTSHGRIARIDLDLGHGYIETPEGGEVYFSRENVANPSFDRLQVGDEVEFLLEAGKNTMLAKRVSVGKHRFGG